MPARGLAVLPTKHAGRVSVSAKPIGILSNRVASSDARCAAAVPERIRAAVIRAPRRDGTGKRSAAFRNKRARRRARRYSCRVVMPCGRQVREHGCDVRRHLLRNSTQACVIAAHGLVSEPACFSRGDRVMTRTRSQGLLSSFGRCRGGMRPGVRKMGFENSCGQCLAPFPWS